MSVCGVRYRNQAGDSTSQGAQILPDLVVDRARGVSLMLVDGEWRWLLTTMGSARDYPPRGEEALREFVGGLGHATLQEALSTFEFIHPIRVRGRTENRLRRHHTMDARPDRFIVFGDAVAAFNSVSGQGMTVAALTAFDLRDELAGRSKDGLAGLADRFQRRLAQTTEYCSLTSTTAAYRVDRVAGPPPPPDLNRITAYFDGLDPLTLEDPDIYLKLMDTMQLMRSPIWLTEQAVKSRVAMNRYALGPKVGAPPSHPDTLALSL